MAVCIHQAAVSQLVSMRPTLGSGALGCIIMSYASPREEAELRAAEDRAVRQAITLQEAAGLDVINDGESL